MNSTCHILQHPARGHMHRHGTLPARLPQIVLLIGALQAPTGMAADYFMASDGKDTQSGTIAQPFASTPAIPCKFPPTGIW